MRTIIDIDPKQLTLLDDFSKKQHTSRASIIRKAISVFIKEHIQVGEKEAFGLWRKDKVDALALQRKMRDEWNDE
ncbi:MAG: hypothetical protein A3F18_08185 [Legionellales bacterium RIFCSPHIGHO2_12_FULL_37_14]|nr:MAG: hypothetical protein A3F18_08185 [Legionellales bacterium RIFCSPHIGHO2_12_FULL_37_14]